MRLLHATWLQVACGPGLRCRSGQVWLQVDSVQCCVILVARNRQLCEGGVSEGETCSVCAEQVAQGHVQDSTVCHYEHVRVACLHDFFQALPRTTFETGA